MAEAVLESAGIAGVFQAVICPEDVANGKPHPDHLAAAIAAVRGQPASAVMVGDSANDVLPALALGTAVIVVDMDTASSRRRRSAQTWC